MTAKEVTIVAEDLLTVLEALDKRDKALLSYKPGEPEDDNSDWVETRDMLFELMQELAGTLSFDEPGIEVDPLDRSKDPLDRGRDPLDRGKDPLDRGGPLG